MKNTSASPSSTPATAGSCSRGVARISEAKRANLEVNPVSGEEVEALTCSIVNKMLHGPTERLKKVGAEKDGYEYVEAARFLYGLDTNPEGKSPHKGLIRSILGRAEKSGSTAKGEMGDTFGT